MHSQALQIHSTQRGVGPPIKAPHGPLRGSLSNPVFGMLSTACPLRFAWARGIISPRSVIGLRAYLDYLAFRDSEAMCQAVRCQLARNLVAQRQSAMRPWAPRWMESCLWVLHPEARRQWEPDLTGLHRWQRAPAALHLWARHRSGPHSAARHSDSRHPAVSHYESQESPWAAQHCPSAVSHRQDRS